jgi:antirestriction protein ArdC
MNEKLTNKEITQKNMEAVREMTERLAAMTLEEVADFYKQAEVFRRYSFSNTIILMMSGASNVMGFRQWKEKGRSVKKGEKAIWLLAPRFKKTDEDRENDSPGSLIGFISVPVFDIAQTEGEELPALMTHNQGRAEMPRLEKTAVKLGFSVSSAPLPYELGGYITQERKITLNSVRPESDHVGTIIHEVSHGLLKHHEIKPEDKNRQNSEQEAELLTYLICRHFGIERDSAFYLKSWGGDDVAAKAFKRIDKAFKEFINTYEEA